MRNGQLENWTARQVSQ